jgi:hypothetical protein
MTRRPDRRQQPRRIERLEVTALLCDYAEEINGKLYIMGGGWSRIMLNRPVDLALAVKIAVPWDQTNVRHSISAKLLTEDGEPVRIEDQAVQLEGHLEVGRPPGLRRGTALDAPLALRFQGLKLQPGSYSWRFEIDGEEYARLPFEAIRGGEQQ